MAKRKREPEVSSNGSNVDQDSVLQQPLKKVSQKTNGTSIEQSRETSSTTRTANGHAEQPLQHYTSLQIITGSYDKVLHGIIATIPAEDAKSSKVHFQDNFLFTAHSSAIKSLALSPSISEDKIEAGKVMLATGGSDEKINLYSVSTSLPNVPSLPTLSSVPSLENPKNKELGVLLHHTSSVNVLYFPSRSKLISGSDDNTIAISRTKDWTVLTKVKAPMPKVQGRPSGDTAPLGGAPAGINDFAVHPSMKLMISVGKGEKCMRLWNLVTGKKANVLNFERDMLQSVGEGKWSRGEGQRAVWNSAGNEFAIAFEKGVAIFGMDSEIKCVALPKPSTKIHQIRYISHSATNKTQESLAVSTENGRLLFYDTSIQENSSGSKLKETPQALLLAFLGGREAGITGRIKDFHVASITNDTKIVVTAGSEGSVMIWRFQDTDLTRGVESVPKVNGKKTEANGSVANGAEQEIQQLGALLGKYDTGNRITCLEALQLHGTSLNDDGDNEELEQSEDEDDSSSENEDAGDDFEGFD